MGRAPAVSKYVHLGPGGINSGELDPGNPKGKKSTKKAGKKAGVEEPVMERDMDFKAGAHFSKSSKFVPIRRPKILDYR